VMSMLKIQKPSLKKSLQESRKFLKSSILIQNIRQSCKMSFMHLKKFQRVFKLKILGKL